MLRYTEFDSKTGQYRLRPDVKIDSKNILQIFGQLEDYKENQERITLGEYLISLRKAKGLSQEDFAKLIHINRQRLVNYERDRTQCPKSVLRDISYFADVPIEEIKSVYKKIYYDLDDEVIKDTFENCFDQAKRNQLTGRILQFEREFYDISKKDLVQAFHQRTGWSSCTSARITKFEAGKYELSLLIACLYNIVFSVHFQINSTGLKTLQNYLDKGSKIK